MIKPIKVWGTDYKSYTIVHRRKSERKCYSFGYRTENLDLLRELAEQDVESGEYSCVKIINADTNEDFEFFTNAHR